MPDSRRIAKASAESILWSADEGWQEFLEPLEDDPGRTKVLAEFLVSLLEALDAGKIKLARAILLKALERTFPYSKEFEENFDNWIAGLHGE